MSLRLCLLLPALLLGAQREGIDPLALPVWSAEEKAQEPLVEAPVMVSDSTGLRASGSKSVQVNVGNGGTDIGQELRLKVEGEVRPGVRVDAHLTDVGQSAGEQVTATLQEVDDMYFSLEGPMGSLRLGDLQWKMSRLGLSGLERSTFGAAGALRSEHAEASALYGGDESERLVAVFSGNAGQRTGYLALPSGAMYRNLVPGSAQVFLNGRRLEEGKDFQLNYAGGVLDFLGSILPGPSDEIRVEVDAYAKGELRQLILGEGAYRSSWLWLDVAGFSLGADTSRLKRGAWSSRELSALRLDDGSKASLAGDSGNVLSRPSETRRAGARLRMALDRRWYLDGELGVSRSDSNLLSSAVEGPRGRAFRWMLSSDSSALQKHGWLRVQGEGDWLQAGFNADGYAGSERAWDSYALREEWDLDSALLPGGLRRDEWELRVRWPGGWYPGFYQGYRRPLEDSAGWNSLRSRGFLLHRAGQAHSELSLERVSSVQMEKSERWQGNGEAFWSLGEWEPFAKGRVAWWERAEEQDTLVRAQAGAQWGKEAGARYGRGELLGERNDTARVAQWTQNARLRGSGWELGHLMQMRQETDLQGGVSSSWLLEQDGRFGGASGAWRGNGTYVLGYTREVPWEPLYKAVPAGTGDVLYDSLTGEYVTGVDKGDYVYEGLGRPDSVAPVRLSHRRLVLDLHADPGPLLGVRQGFVADLGLGLRGTWEAWDTASGIQARPPLLRSWLREHDEGICSATWLLAWTHPRGEGSLEAEAGEEDEKDGSSWREKRWQRLDGRYTGRKEETWILGLLREEVIREAILDLRWTVYELAPAWRRELGLGFAAQPGGRARVSKGDDGYSSLGARLVQLGTDCFWNDSRGNGASAGLSWTRVESVADALPYALMEGFGIGRTWRATASASWALQEHFQFALGYTARWGSAEEGVFQKLSSEARAFF